MTLKVTFRSLHTAANYGTEYNIQRSTHKKGEIIWGIFFSTFLLPLWSIGLISQFLDHFTDGRTPWTGDQLVSRPLPKHRTTRTQNKRIHTPNMYALCRNRTHDPGFRASEDSTCLIVRPLGYRGRFGGCRNRYKVKL
jgi:hypothetical protein